MKRRDTSGKTDLYRGLQQPAAVAAVVAADSS